MKKKPNYYIERNSDTKEMVYVEFEKMPCYEVKPRVSKEDAIRVDKIVFVSPTMSEKLIKKKIDRKIEKYLQVIKIIEEDDGSATSGDIRKFLVDAERYKLKIINEYAKFLGNTYTGLTLEKMQLIIKELRSKLYFKQMKESFFRKIEEVPEKKGKSR